jgi:hypothetical protein
VARGVRLDQRGVRDHVVVQEEEQGSGCGARAPVAGGGRTGVRLLENCQREAARRLRGPRASGLGRTVRASVADDDHLEPPGAARLPLERAEDAQQQDAALMRGDDDGGGGACDPLGHFTYPSERSCS